MSAPGAAPEAGRAVSVVVPVFGGARHVPELLDRIERSLGDRLLEVLLVDDGSAASTWDQLVACTATRPRSHAIRLGATLGSIAARGRGAALASGVVVATIDADGEYAPEDLPVLVAAVDAGADLVSGVRRHQRGRPLVRRLAAPVLRTVMGPALRHRPRDLGCGLKAWSGELGRRAAAADGPGGPVRFLVALYQGARRVEEVPVGWHPRPEPSSHSGRARARLGLALIGARWPWIDRLRPFGPPGRPVDDRVVAIVARAGDAVAR